MSAGTTVNTIQIVAFTDAKPRVWFVDNALISASIFSTVERVARPSVCMDAMCASMVFTRGGMCSMLSAR